MSIVSPIMVKKMSTRTQNILALTAKNLSYGGIALIITAAYILYAQPSNINVFLAPYTGEPSILGGVLVCIGGLESAIGFVLKNMMHNRGF